MKKTTLLFTFTTALGIIACLNVHAQFGGLLQKAKDKAAQKASDAIDKKISSPPATTTTTAKGKRAVINEGFDFVPGDTVLLADDFLHIATGASTHTFKTNGSASVVTINGENGKWLALAQRATYKFNRQLFYPKHFTLEFDIFAAADQIRDIYPVVFGFTNDNSIRDFNSGDGAYVSLKYYNDHDVDVNSSFISKYLNTEFDLTAFNNRPMHVSMEVDGDRMVVYLDKTKLADTQAFLPGTQKNFYISGPMEYHNGSKAMAGNFRVMGFKNK